MRFDAIQFDLSWAWTTCQLKADEDTSLLMSRTEELLHSTKKFDAKKVFPMTSTSSRPTLDDQELSLIHI